eukprot:6156731-Amphidinium_carterae.1
MQAHGAEDLPEVPQVPQAYGADDKGGKGKDKGKDKNKPPRGGGAGRGGNPKGAGGKPTTPNY